MSKDEKLPEGMALTPLDEEFRRDPYPTLHDLRRRAPVHRDDALSRWMLTRHDDVSRVLRDKGMSVDPRKAQDGEFHRIFDREVDGRSQPSMLFLDDPDHRRLRGLVSKAFTARAVEAMRPRSREIARQLLDAVDEPEFDLIERFAGPLPTVVISEMLGVDPNQRDDFKRWSDVSTAAFFNPFASEEQSRAGEEANGALEDYFRGEIARRHAEPNDDLIGRLVKVEEEGDRLDDDEIVTMCNLLLVAGNITTTDLIGNGVRALCEHPAELAKLRAHPEKIQNAVEEMLRYDSPVVNSGRIPLKEEEVGGCPIHAGQSVVVALGAANRDPDVYPDPDRFDVDREDTHHHSFGGGIHSCLGAPLARVEAQEAISELVARYPRLRAGDKGHTDRAIPSFRGCGTYWVRVD